MSHITLHKLHKEHNVRIRTFHKNHEIQIQNGENGNRLLAKWERYFYFNVIVPFKKIK